MKMNFFPALLIRHDLDEISSIEFEKFIDYETNIGGKFTYFVLAHQVTKNTPVVFSKGMTESEKIRRRKNYQAFINKKIVNNLGEQVEFALHSEAKPASWNSDNIISLYTNSLMENKEVVESKIGEVRGHSAHSDHGAMYINTDGINHTTIEKDSDILLESSLNAGFTWMSCAKDLSYFRLGVCTFPPTSQPYYFKQLLVFPIAWDDYYFYNTRKSGRIDLKKAKESIESKLHECFNKNIPCVVSLHPMRFLKSNPRFLYSIDIVNWLLEKADKIGMKCLTFSMYKKLWEKDMRIKV